MMLDTSIKCSLVYYNKEGELPFKLTSSYTSIPHDNTFITVFGSV